MANHERPEAWVTIVAEDDVRAAMGGRRLPYEAYMGGVISRLARLLASHDLIGATFSGVGPRSLFGPGALSRAEREMVAAVASAAQDCHY